MADITRQLLIIAIHQVEDGIALTCADLIKENEKYDLEEDEEEEAYPPAYSTVWSVHLTENDFELLGKPTVGSEISVSVLPLHEEKKFIIS